MSLFSRVLLAFVLLGGLASSLPAQQVFDPQARVNTVAKFLNADTLVIVRADLSRLDFEALGKFLLESGAPPESVDVKRGQEAQAAWTKAGLREVYVIFGMRDVADFTSGQVFAVAPVAAGHDPEQALAAMKEIKPPSRLPGPLPGAGEEEAFVAHGCIVVSGPGAKEKLMAFQAAERADFVEALRVAGNTDLQVVFVPPAPLRAMAKDAPLPLPPNLVKAVQTLALDSKWLALTANLPPRQAVGLFVEMSNPDAATIVRDGAKAGLDIAAEMIRERDPNAPGLDKLRELLLPARDGARLRIILTEANGGIPAVKEAVAPQVAAARGAAGRARSMNNLRQIALAVHNFHDVTDKLPTPAGGGKPNLSWRVQLLPYLEEQALYEQFRQDEPWDSEHNKALIAKMPAVFASPATPDLAAKGLTTYVAPVGEKTIFGAPGAKSFRDVIDGTSNTIMFVEANAASAVVWTKPEDLPIDFKAPLKGLAGQAQQGFSACFTDGSVRFFAETIDPDTLRKLLQCNDGEAVEIP